MTDVVCKTCNKKFQVYPYQLKQGKGKYCSRKCWIKSKKGENSPWYKHGNSKSNGYPVINVLGEGQIKEHRYVVENHLGRKLESYEHVHHINGDKTDNRLENLQLMSAKEHFDLHAKQRIKERPILICDYCSTKFRVEPKRKDKARFCSRKCASHWKVKEMKKHG